jgi:hypothetical protein
MRADNRQPGVRLRLSLWAGAGLLLLLVAGIIFRVIGLALSAFLLIVFGALPAVLLSYVDYVRHEARALARRPVLSAAARAPVRALGLLSLALGTTICLGVPYLVAHRELGVLELDVFEPLGLGVPMLAFGWWWLRGTRGERPK